MLEKTEFKIADSTDIVLARGAARRMAARMSFSPVAVTAITTAVSELSRNIVQHAGAGAIHLEVGGASPGTQYLLIEAIDHGPGNCDVAKAMQPGFSTVGGLGLGLPGVKALMDSFQITSVIGLGTTVRVTKLLRGRGGWRV